MNTNTNLKLSSKATQAAISKLSTFAATASAPKPIREFSQQQKMMVSDKKLDQKMNLTPKFDLFQKKSILNSTEQFTLLNKLQKKNATDLKQVQIDHFLGKWRKWGQLGDSEDVEEKDARSGWAD